MRPCAVTLLVALCSACGGSTSPAPPVDARATDALVCPEEQTPCGLGCVTLASDPKNCGRCGNDCAVLGEAECQEGRCVFVGTCTAPEKLCDNRCVNVLTDNFNCGDCRVPCEIQKSFRCEGGQCECLPGRTECMGHCVDTNEDEGHCGECNNKCEGREICTDGSCVEQP